MNYYYDPKERDRIAEARESFSGRLLTNSQFDEAMMITGILEREIHRSGSFKDKLGDYAYAMARSEKMDAVKAETIVRDLFKARTGQTMNQMREGLAERQDKLPKEALDKAYQYAADIGDMVRDGNKMSFYRAYAHQAEALAREFNVTDAGAKDMMHRTFKETEDRELFDWGKELDDQYYRPQIDAEKKEREEARDKSSRSRSSDGGEQPRSARGSYHAQSRGGPSRPRP